MKRPLSLVLICFFGLAIVLLATVLAQEIRESSPFFVEVIPPARSPGIYDLIVPVDVMDKSREDLADLRLYNAQGNEVPYALRIRSEVDDTTEVATKVFNQARVGSISETSVDLGDSPGEHNEVEVETSGSNFRRRVEVEGADSAGKWRLLKTGDVIFSFESQNRTLESNRISYPASRYRYLRIRVYSDELSDKQAPVINTAKVAMTRREKGESTTWPTYVSALQLMRNQGAPASSWTIDLGGQAPCDRLILDIANESFSRPFQVEAVDDPQNVRFITSGELTKRIGEEHKPLIVTFEKETFARKLRLVISDYSNPPLSLTSITAGASARQVVFELKDLGALPLTLFFGDSKATAPHYDFEKDLGTKLAVPPGRCRVGDVTANPAFKPEPQPLTERIPWLIYVVLTASSIALGIVLIALARATLRDAAQRENQNT